ncbi:MAG TPA: hypothetical protein VKV95_07920 [Terriglobia bacterium]|nr:hypothetical protein [Terriglobia bacterium]
MTKNCHPECEGTRSLHPLADGMEFDKVKMIGREKTLTAAASG